MYLNINIVLIILLYQCLMIICSSLHGMDGYPSKISSKSGFKDCIFPIPGKNDLKMPHISMSEPYSTYTTDSGNLTIKHNSYFNLTCQYGKFKSFIEKSPNEITVKCLEGRSVLYKQYAYEYDYFECDDTQRMMAARKAFRKIFIPKTRKTRPIRKNDCVLHLPKAPLKMPILFTFNNTVNTLIHPDRRGKIVVRYNETFKMACVGSRFGFPTRYSSEIMVRCLNTSYIEYKHKTVEFNKFRCTAVPKSTMRTTNHSCQDSMHDVYDVGFQTKRDFLVVYKICYDNKNKNNLFSWYTVVTPIYHRRQKENNIPNFIKATLQNGFNLTAVYANQTQALINTIKSEELTKLIIKTDVFNGIHRYLTPGLLLTPSEFIYLSEQRSTYVYENTAPFWYEFYHGIWTDIERLFRKSMSKNIYRHVVVSGTYGACLLPNKTEDLHPLHLSLPPGVTVPEYIWRMDYNMDREAGLVFLILNNPYKKIDLKTYICDHIPCPGGLKRKSMHSIKGLLFCCTKAGFEEVYGRIDPIVYWDYTVKKEPDQFSGIL